ncbi:hypothetical protein FIV06_19465 [Labrenzia sp. THAF191b]|nr:MULTISPECIES: HipA family kinase [unclassified Labrenzia]QFS99619.1 hypothetical protein FIV06_19465 [Labrenzia sp. THAF191b]QFT05933.1 hypothetical protein FIV05_19460 [Labrenzia sp. THAF191a]QFT17477.1 hypothetical protein FIV03_19475 [Labrenzia sp. THAF187b]
MKKMVQMALTPLRVVEHRVVNFGTAHAFGRAQCEDGKYYIVKRGGIEHHLCATEYFCHSMADLLNLPIHQYKPLMMPDGELVFGSTEQDPVLNELLAYRLITEGNNNQYKIENFKEIYSATLAFDLVIANKDRHANNFLLKENPNSSSDTTTSTSVSLIDFGSAQIFTEPATSFPLNIEKQSNTIRLADKLRGAHGFSDNAAERVLRTIDQSSEFLAERAFFGMPEEWFDPVDREQFLENVKGGLLKRQVEFVRNGMENGVFL